MGITGALQVNTIKSQQFAAGTEYVTGEGYPDGIDTVHARVNKGERIVDSDTNRLIPRGFKNQLIPLAVNNFLRGNVQVYDNPKVLKHLEGIENNTRQNKGYKANGALAWEIKGNHKYYY
jgi:coenzyme F420-reducing hydrogenase alpha subunit